MAVGAECHPDIRVAQDPLDSMRIYTGPQEQSCCRVSQIVKSHPAGEGARPKLHAALAAASQPTVWMPCRVTASASCFAPTAHVLIALYHPGASERCTENLLRIGLLSALGSISARKDPSAWRASDGVFKVGHEGFSDRNGIGMPTFRGVSIVGTGDCQRAIWKVDICFEQTTQLALA